MRSVKPPGAIGGEESDDEFEVPIYRCLLSYKTKGDAERDGSYVIVFVHFPA
jgi:hypothetical protein